HPGVACHREDDEKGREEEIGCGRLSTASTRNRKQKNMTTVGILGAGMVGSTWLYGVPWNALEMTPLVFEPAGIDVVPFDRVAEASELGVCDIVLVFVSGGIAEAAIRSTFSPDETTGPDEFLDFSSNGPEGKKRIADWCIARGSTYVDVTILGAVAANGLSTPVAVAGAPSKAAERLLAASGASQLRVENSEAGAAARLKLV